MRREVKRFERMEKPDTGNKKKSNHLHYRRKGCFSQNPRRVSPGNRDSIKLGGLAEFIIHCFSLRVKWDPLKKSEENMELTKDEALQMLKAVTILLLDCVDRGTLSQETYVDVLELLLKLEYALGS